MINLNLLVLRAHDPERLVRFYGSFGLKFVEERHGIGAVHFSANAGAATVEIYPRQTPGDSTSHTRLGFTVQSLSQVLAAPEIELGQIVSLPRASPWGWRAIVEDPEGHKIELVEHLIAPSLPTP